MVAAGLCQAVVKAVRTKSWTVCDKVLRMLLVFIEHLSPDLRQAAVTILVAGGVVERAVRHLVEKGPATDGYLVELLCFLAEKPQAGERLSSKGVVDQLVHWIAKWLVKVRDMVLNRRKRQGERGKDPGRERYTAMVVLLFQQLCTHSCLYLHGGGACACSCMCMCVCVCVCVCVRPRLR